jgi:FG-GAP-like repeat
MRFQPVSRKCQLITAVVRTAMLAGLLFVVDGTPAAAQRPGPGPSCVVPAARPWEFLDASSQIEFIPDTTTTKIFRAIQFADFNKDGRLDVVSAQAVSGAGVTGTAYPSVLYMNENGHFVDRTTQYIPWLNTPQVRWWVVPHDFVGALGPADGWIDLYVGRGGGKPSRFFRNLGVDASNQWLGFEDESWRIKGATGGRSIGDSYHQHKADLDGDGWMDVVEYPNGGAGAGQIRAMMNRNGTFVDETVGRLPLRSEPSLFGHVEDLNGDGFPDISVANLNPPSGVPKVRVLINDGTGHFPASLEQTVPQPASTLGVYGIEHLDVNGDGKLDIYVVNFGKGNESARDAILLNLGTGNQLFNTVYYPEFPNGSNKDSDGDHPVGADFDGDGRIDISTAQFATRTFVLHNKTCNGVTKLVEETPIEVPAGSAFRLRTFDANGDGAPDLWIGRNQPNVGHSLMIGNVPEQEPNNVIGGASPTTTFPALRTGVIASASDQDIFKVPAQAVTDGARFILKPVAGSDLQLALLDENGSVLASSAGAGAGSPEQIEITPGAGNRYLGVAVQGTLGTGLYRLSMEPASGQSSLETVEEALPAPPATPRR